VFNSREVATGKAFKKSQFDYRLKWARKFLKKILRGVGCNHVIKSKMIERMEIS